MGEAFKPKLTGEQRAEVFRRALNGEKTCDLAREFNVSTNLISRIKYDPKRLKTAEKKMTARQLYTKLRVHMAADKGVEKEHEILDRPVPDGKEGVSLLYLQHQAAVDAMNRSGLRENGKDSGGVTVVFANDTGFEPGMPTEMAESDEEQ